MRCWTGQLEPDDLAWASREYGKWRFVEKIDEVLFGRPAELREAMEIVLRSPNPDLDEQCLTDGNPDVRHQAVKLLGNARPRSDVAVPALIERLTDEDWLVVPSVILALGGFGPLAAAAIPRIGKPITRMKERMQTFGPICAIATRSRQPSFVKQTPCSDCPEIVFAGWEG